jgi:hypothetical protein
MAKTDLELREYFKQVANRQDWTQEDFLSARQEAHDFFEQIDFLIRSIAHISTSSDLALSRILNRINQARTAINNEISRRLV